MERLGYGIRFTEGTLMVASSLERLVEVFGQVTDPRKARGVVATHPWVEQGLYREHADGQEEGPGSSREPSGVEGALVDSEP